MSHSVKRAKSRNEQFRTAVPPDIRPLVGEVEWTASLGTTDPVAAAAKRGELIAFHKNEILRLRGQQAHKPVEDALALLDRGFERLAIIRGSMDKAIAEQLALLASTVIDSWLPADQLGQPQDWGGMTIWEAPGDPEPVPSIDTEPEREIFRLRAALLEGTGRSDGILYLQRTGLYSETLDPVTVEVALIMDELAVFVPGLVYMRHRNGSLWLVPQQVGPYIEVSENGLAVSSVPPFVTWDERTDGVCRAAAEIVRLVRRRGH